MKMKNIKWWLMGIVTIFLSVNLQGGVDERIGNWKGNGAFFDISGKKIKEYQIEMITSQIEDGVIEAKTKIISSDGTVQNYSEQMKFVNGWIVIKGNQGEGGGFDCGEGLEETYVKKKSGDALAITTIYDQKDVFRVLKTVLKKGDAIGFYREKLTRN